MTRSDSPRTGIPGLDDQIGAGEDEPRTLSLMSGVARPEGLPEADLEFESMKGPSKFLSQGTMLLVLIFAVAAGSLYAMKLTQREVKADPTAKEVEARVEQALAKLASPAAMPEDDPLRQQNIDDLFRDTRAIVAMFSQDMTQRQVPIDYVAKNPFAIHAVAEVTPDAPANVAREDRKLERLNKELGELELQTIMFSARPVAVISNEICRPGDKLGSFTIKEVRKSAVVLESDGHTFMMKMEKEEEDQGRRSNRLR